jgi:hypothetical protein
MLMAQTPSRGLTVGRVIHFEITADDVDRASDFYAGVFGWKLEPTPFVDGYQLAHTGDGDGIDGAIMARTHQSQPAIVWIRVDDVERSLTAVSDSGGTRAGDVNTIPGRGLVALVTDTEGNVIGLHQPQ